MSEDSERNSAINRRRVLQAVGGTAGAVIGTGVAGATPGRGGGKGGKNGGKGDEKGGKGVGPCTCGSCPDGTFCGKVEGPPEEGKTYTFSSDDDSFSVTVDEVVTKEGGDEVTCFEFSTSDTVEKVCVKGGPDTATYGNDPAGSQLCAPTNPGGQQSEISNFSFCGTGSVEYYQIDLVQGEVIKDFGEEGAYGSSRRYETFTVSEEGTLTANLDASGTATKNGCTLDWSGFGFDASDDTADVDVTLTDAESEPCTITLAGYLLPEGDTTFVPGNLEDQTYRDHETVELNDDESATLTIDLDG